MVLLLPWVVICLHSAVYYNPPMYVSMDMAKYIYHFISSNVTIIVQNVTQTLYHTCMAGIAEHILELCFLLG